MLVQQVNVAAWVPGIDPEQVSDKFTMAMPEIINIPYPTSRDIRNLLPFLLRSCRSAGNSHHRL